MKVLKKIGIGILAIGFVAMIGLIGYGNMYESRNCIATITIRNGTAAPTVYYAKSYNIKANGCVDILTMDGQSIVVCGNYIIQ